MRSKGIQGYQDSTIGVLALEVATTPFSVGINHSIEQTALAKGWNSLIFNTSTPTPSEETVERVLSHKPTGIIFATMGLREVIVPERLKEVPLVLANCYTQDHSIPSYIPNDTQGQLDGMLNLIDKGYKKPLFIMLNESQPAVPFRKLGIDEAYKGTLSSKDKFRWRYMAEPCNYHETIKYIDGAYAENYNFDCIVCGNDRIALIAYMHLHRIGKSIPNDVGILGFDNMDEIADLFVPGLTSIQLPHHELGKQAALHIIENRKVSGINKVNCPLVERESL